MNQTTRTDLVILGAAMAGLIAVEGARTLRKGAGADPAAPLVVLPSLVAAATLTRRVGQMTSWYPDRTALLGAGAFSLGFGIGLFSQPLRALLPKVG